MKIKNKKVLIFPEYHLTDFPPQISLSSQEAYDLLIAYKKFGFDILISGYVESDEINNYSSCLIIDGENIHNIRKSRPYKDEIGIISSGIEINKPINLSIGLSCFVLCHELSFLLNEEYKNIFKHEIIENLILISAMFYKFKENSERGLDFCRKYKIKRFITADRFFGVNQTEITHNLG
jgi:predicted amidohydrolase